MNGRREPGMGPAVPHGTTSGATRPINVTVSPERRGGNTILFWLLIAAMLLTDLTILWRVWPMLLELWTASDLLADTAPLEAWLLTLITANLVFGIPALLSRPR